MIITTYNAYKGTTTDFVVSLYNNLFLKSLLFLKSFLFLKSYLLHKQQKRLQLYLILCNFIEFLKMKFHKLQCALCAIQKLLDIVLLQLDI